MCVGSDATVLRVIAGASAVGGVTSLGDDVFVVREDSHGKIEVYDAKTFTLQRHIAVPALGDCPYGLVACSHNNCLYASDSVNDSVHRVELSGSDAVMKWSVARRPAGLSVNGEHNLIVVSTAESKLQIFTTVGTLLQVIQLQAHIGHPWNAIRLPALLQNIQRHGQLGFPVHAVQRSSDTFLVSHCSYVHRVCLVGVDGSVVRSYGGQEPEEGAERTRLNGPSGLAVDGEGRVLVADRCNDRLLVMDQSLSSAHEMSVSVDGGLKGPDSLWYDQSRGRLYVGERNGGRVIAVDSLKDFAVSKVSA